MKEKIPQLNTIVEPENSKENKEKLSLRILVAEDGELLRDMVKEILTEKGYVVETVENGRLLIKKLLSENGNWDLVITDNSMPIRNDGIKAINEMRLNERLKNIPVVLMTGDLLIGAEKSQLKDLGAVYLPKPFSVDELRDAIDRITKKPESIK